MGTESQIEKRRRKSQRDGKKTTLIRISPIITVKRRINGMNRIGESRYFI
jgi:hypothetical protein